MNGYPDSEDSKGAVCARVHDIFPPQGNSGVSTGVIYIESGLYADEKALFDRKDCSLFGWPLEKTDLQYVLDLNEPCFVKLERIHDAEELEVKLRVTSLWIGWPMSHAKYRTPNEIPSEDRHRFLLFLESHNLTIKDFLSVINGEKIPR